MGSVLSGILGTQNNFKPDSAGQDFGQAIASSQQNINQNFQNQGNLAQALQAQMSGAGPNPAQAMLNQSTDRNIKQNAALMASQKGINAGATQRQAALNAAAEGQQAVGQGALMGAQQQLAAQGQLGSLYGQMGAQQQANQGAYQGQLANINNQGATIAQNNAQASGQAIGGLLQGASSIGSMAATGGASGGMGGGGGGAAAMGNSSSSSKFGGLGGNYSYYSKGGPVQGTAQVKGDSLKNDTVHAMLSPGEIVVPRSKASDPQKAKEFIDHVMGAQGKSEAPSFGEIAKLKERIKALEKKVKK